MVAVPMVVAMAMVLLLLVVVRGTEGGCMLLLGVCVCVFFFLCRL